MKTMVGIDLVKSYITSPLGSAGSQIRKIKLLDNSLYFYRGAWDKIRHGIAVESSILKHMGVCASASPISGACPAPPPPPGTPGAGPPARPIWAGAGPGTHARSGRTAG